MTHMTNNPLKLPFNFVCCENLAVLYCQLGQLHIRFSDPDKLGLDLLALHIPLHIYATFDNDFAKHELMWYAAFCAFFA